MPKKKKTAKRNRETTKKKSRSSHPTKPKRKPIGFVKTKGRFRLVFGSKSKPRLDKKSFKSKKSLTKHASKFF